MAEISAEKLAQRAFDLDLLDAHQLEAVWGEFGSRDVALDDLTALLLRKEYLTNFQIDRLLEGKRDGYFYGDYKVLYLVGAGTFARVYRAVHREKGKVVAVKVLRQRYADDVVTRERFAREARMVMPLRHPNIVPIFEVLEDRGRSFMVMDFVEGQNLRDFLKVRRHMDLDNAMRITADILSGLEYALRKGVTHRDLKLSNVLISAHGRARLVDFGLAAVSGDMSDESIATAANPRSIDYAGLERATGVRKNDPRSDIYFTGCMLYHMLGGKAPLHETRDRIQRLAVSRFREVKPLSSLVPDLPNFVAAFVNKAMDLNPDKRYQNPSEMLDDLKKIVLRLQQGGDLSGTLAAEIGSVDTPLDLGGPSQLEGDSFRVMIVDSDVNRQNMLRDALKKRGYRVLVVSDPDRALNRFSEHDDNEALADCAIFATHELGTAALEAYNRFGADDKTRNYAAILLVDSDNKDLALRATAGERRLVMFEPITIGKLRTALLQLLRPNTAKDVPISTEDSLQAT